MVIPDMATKANTFHVHPIGGYVFLELNMEIDAATFRTPPCSFVDRPGSFFLRSRVSCETEGVGIAAREDYVE
jgi:hypothetical protein